MKNALFTALALALLAAGLAIHGEAQSGAGNLHHRYNLLGEGIALLGYDPVSYFPEGGGNPRKGLISLAFEYDGVTYRFSSKEDLERFKTNPRKYVPVYGGWCAWAVGELGKRVDVDPLSFEIRQGKLYLFYRDRSLDTRALWLKKESELISKGNANWPALAR